MPEIDNAHDELPRDGGFASQLARLSRRRKLTAIGVVGVALLGTGAFVATDLMTGPRTTRSGEVGALRPVDPDPAAAPASSTGVSASGHPDSSAAVRASTTASGAPQTVAERVAAAKAAGAKSDGRIKRPLPNPAGAVAADRVRTTEDGVTIRETGSLKKGPGTMRIVSARRDLTGEREFAWPADAGESVGNARCTHKLRLSPDAEMQVLPTLLLCWRTSAARSVCIVAVKLNAQPSKRAIVSEIDRVWSKLS
jgi:hypothetical protein